MIRKFMQTDLISVTEIWLNANLKAHSFIPEEYWERNLETVKNMLPQAEIYVYEDEKTHRILGFAGLTGSYLAGIFVEENSRSRGIGKQLIDSIKKIKPEIHLNVYKKNIRAVSFYLREDFTAQSESVDSNTNEKELLMTWKSFDNKQ